MQPVGQIERRQPWRAGNQPQIRIVAESAQGLHTMASKQDLSLLRASTRTQANDDATGQRTLAAGTRWRVAKDR